MTDIDTQLSHHHHQQKQQLHQSTHPPSLAAASNVSAYNRMDINNAAAMSTEKPIKKALTEKMLVHLMVGFREICFVTASLPLLTLILCFAGAVIFQAKEVHETHCQVFNIIPSISAVTGVSPQRYFWRISVALHIGPRFLIAACYRNHYSYLLEKQIALATRTSIKSIDDITSAYKFPRLLVRLVFWFHFIEITALCGVTYVSNLENYPLHEKIFITFMTFSLCHMLLTIKLHGYLYPKDTISNQTSSQLFLTPTLPTERELTSLKWKKRLFTLSILSTIGLIIFFMKHRFYCHDLAFSFFALCEYIIAISNLAFHYTAVLDFPHENLVIAQDVAKMKAKSN